MSTYLFVHGSWHGAWCWKKVVPLIEQAGHHAVTLDLPGRGDDATPVGHASLQTYAERVVAVLDALSSRVVLVGHSMAGVVVSHVAEMRPEKIATLVYLAAFLPQNGQSINAIKKIFLGLSGNVDAPLTADPDTIIDRERGVSMIRKERARDVLYHDCSDEDVTYALSRLCPESTAIGSMPLTLTAERFECVPRIYIAALQDRRVKPELQKAMYTAQPCHKVFSLETSHSPFFSAPEELVSILTSFDHLI
ncbi:MAG TPA: alpha/beta fold hydrolase [Ktedonobacteraceae bacterium]|nr:alpha/beta fold hydrolase [Ktedonobacteraceae bacterium]